jgi:hypothetical protein
VHLLIDVLALVVYMYSYTNTLSITYTHTHTLIFQHTHKLQLTHTHTCTHFNAQDCPTCGGVGKCDKGHAVSAKQSADQIFKVV